MRAAAEHALAGHAGFHSVDGRAEAIPLDDASVDLVSAATAFHWFEPTATRTEFARILRDDGYVALFWNLRRRDTTFMRAYEAVLARHCSDYAIVNSRRRADASAMAEFLAGGVVADTTFANAQHLGFDALFGRVLSSSYAPRPGNPAHVPMRNALRILFDTHAVDGHITLDYATRLHVGRVT